MGTRLTQSTAIERFSAAMGSNQRLQVFFTFERVSALKFINAAGQPT